MLVSVCIPTYQGERHIVEAVRSALSQEGVELEVVVSDNASTDRTPEILASFDDERLRVVRSAHTVDLPTNFRTVIAASKGEFVKLLCDDDVLAPGSLARQSAVLRDRPHVSLVACRRNFIDGKGRLLASGVGLRGISGECAPRSIARRYVRTGINPVGDPACAMFRRRDYEEVGGWPDHGLVFTSDLELWLRLLTRGTLYAQAEIGSSFRISDDGLSQTVDASNYKQNRAYIRRVASDERWQVTRSDRILSRLITRASWWQWRLRRFAIRRWAAGPRLPGGPGRRRRSTDPQVTPSGTGAR